MRGVLPAASKQQLGAVWTVREAQRAMTVARPALPAAGKSAVVTEAGAGGTQPLFRFGLLSDVQYADKEDGASFHGTPRYYRYALQQLDAAVRGGWGAGLAGVELWHEGPAEGELSSASA